MPVLQTSRRLGLTRSTSSSTDLVEVAPGNLEMKDVSRLADTPAEVVHKKVRIFQPSRKVMQSSSKPGQWRLEFPREKRYQNPLMGWTGTDDTMYQTVVILC